MKLEGSEWRKEKLNEIKEKVKRGEALNEGEEMALQFWAKTYGIE